jgi:hypothetical protein
VAISETMIAEPSITQMTAATANLMQIINTIEKPVENYIFGKISFRWSWKLPKATKKSARISFQHKSKSSDTS